MKKIIPALAAALMAAFCLVFAAFAENEPGQTAEETDEPEICSAYGDLDSDGELTANDARIALRASVGLQTLTDTGVKRADTDGDGAVTSADARELLRLSVGIGQRPGHDVSGMTEIIKATCSTKGLSVGVCSVCGQFLTVRELSPHTHVGGEWIASVPATCLKGGLSERFCAYCGVKVDQKNTEKAEHTYGEWVYPGGVSCFEPVERYRVCSVCGEKQTETENPPAEHSMKLYSVKATCTSEGSEVYKCTRCGYVEYEKVIPMKSHVYFKEEITKAPTCTEEGLKQRLCIYCGNSQKDEVLPANGHNFDEKHYKIVKEPLCFAEGQAEYTCHDCGGTELRAIPKTEHKLVGDWTVIKEPTASEPGLKQAVCRTCGTITEEIPATGE